MSDNLPGKSCFSFSSGSFRFFRSLQLFFIHPSLTSGSEHESGDEPVNSNGLIRTAADSAYHAVRESAVSFSSNFFTLSPLAGEGRSHTNHQTGLAKSDISVFRRPELVKTAQQRFPSVFYIILGSSIFVAYFII
jgi:hypothetical protein